SIAAGTLDAANYDFPGANLVGNTLTITKAHLTVTADPQTKAFGAAVPSLTYRISGFVNGNTSSVVADAPKVTTTATAASSLGSYPISIAAGTLSAANYDFPAANFIGSTLTVTPPLVTMTNVSAVLTKRRWVMKILVTFSGSVNVTEAQE